ncbi:hypothetical protein [Nocardiopsis alkaliphila]|uniref:hypothetical protein n=1 Tax=Nocardiopsis alkaliphila TaxID=225762 RepID=UPI0003697DF3|nr:hypothetical protein [Nocardiopsis alkaliphila]
MTPDISGEGTGEGSGEHREEVSGAERTEEDTEQARAAAEDFLEALRDGDGETGCAVIDEDAHSAVTLSTMNSGEGGMETECQPAFPIYAERFNGADVAQIREVEMGTDSEGKVPIATVHLEYAQEVAGQTADDLLFWLMDDGEWRIRTVPFGGP